MKRSRGFTLLELVVTVAILGALMTAAVVSFRSAQRNANISAAAFDLVLKLQGYRTRAMNEQRDLLVVVNGGDGGACELLRQSGCVHVFTLGAPQPAWTLGTFSPASPGANVAEVVETVTMPKGMLIDAGAAGMPGKVPFTRVLAWDPDLTAVCGGATCAAIRFQANGSVRGEKPDGTVVAKPGHVIALTTDLRAQTLGAERRAVLVSFPAGIVKSYTY